MASPTPTSDPVTASPTPPVSDPIVASDRPDKPIMGNIVSFLGTIGPLGLAVSQLLVGSASIRAPPTTSRHQINSALSMPPPHKGVQLSSYRHDDPIYPSEQSRRLPERRLGPSRRLWDGYHRYLPDPESSVMTNVVRSHSLHRRDRKDSQLPADSSSKRNGRRRLVSRRLAPAHQDDPVDVDRALEDLKAAIKARHPSQYAGENLEALAADYRKDARELTTAGQYDHNLTLTMLKTSLLAGGAGNEDFRFPLRSTKQRLDQALLDIGYKESQAPMLTWSPRN
ncbi:hypothetical protein MHU86_19255 [Fragilaria crotonensis]|nr:hypothetical protein MHU86_19255 [Fragilaria crotonensis]